MAKVPPAIRRQIPLYPYASKVAVFKKVASYWVPPHLLDATHDWLRTNCNQQRYILAGGGDKHHYADFATLRDGDAYADWLRQQGEQPLTPDQKHGFAPVPGTKAD